jgi:hypothetical protein
MCTPLGLDSHWWSILGLTSDFVGVIALGIDVIRIQFRLRQSARDSLERYRKFEEDYGGSGSSLEDYSRQLARFPDDRTIGDTLDRTRGSVADLAATAAGLGEYVDGLAATLKERVSDEQRLANTSLRFSGGGMVLILIGFVLQMLGTLPC